MIRILFVDDDEHVLAGLRNRLRSQRSRWDMMFVQSGDEALDELQLAPFDVIVSDMRMPIMDGAQLLAHVKERHPEVARIVLSGDAEREAVLRALPIAHQFLSKPCDGNVLTAAIERACLMRSILCDPGLRALVAQLGPLPTLPPIYHALVRATRDPQTDGAQLARLLATDARLGDEVTRLASAAGLVAAEAGTPLLLQSLTLAAALFAPVAGDAPLLAELTGRALRAARLARQLVAPRQAETAFAAGLLCYLGQIVLARALPERMRLVESAAGDKSLPERQTEGLGATGSELSAHLLSEWSVSPAVVEIVAFLHRPEARAMAPSETLTAVQVAEALAGSDGARLDAELSQRAEAAVPRWREIAAHELRATGS
jgi:DNA-binding NarL/FixJ family response regulator